MPPDLIPGYLLSRLACHLAASPMVSTQTCKLTTEYASKLSNSNLCHVYSKPITSCRFSPLCSTSSSSLNVDSLASVFKLNQHTHFACTCLHYCLTESSRLTFDILSRGPSSLLPALDSFVNFWHSRWNAVRLSVSNLGILVTLPNKASLVSSRKGFWDGTCKWCSKHHTSQLSLQSGRMEVGKASRDSVATSAKQLGAQQKVILWA